MAKKIIYLGHYGSGKTELSLAEAFLLAEKGLKVTLVDLDIVNPYFRSGEKRRELEAQGIRVITPNFEGTTVAVPSLPAEINSVFDDDGVYAVFDVGGSPSGAAALGRYSRKIEQGDYETVLVVNAARPFTKTPEDVYEMAKAIEEKCRLPLKSVINNTNAAYDTTPEMVEEAQGMVEEAARMLGAGVKAIAALPSVIEGLSDGFREKHKDILRPVVLRMRPEWLDGQF
jgi:hypothetical protein